MLWLSFTEGHHAMLESTAERVARNTPDEINERIAREARYRIDYYRRNPEGIGRRLEELGREWDIERVLQMASSTLTLSGLALGIGVSRKWLLLSLAVQGFFLRHTTQGWCPPLPLLRRLGIRTAQEIEQEREALLSVRAEPYAGPEPVHAGETRRQPIDLMEDVSASASDTVPSSTATGV